MFICIAIGLSLGAFQFWFATIGFIFIIIVILVKSQLSNQIRQNNFFLSLNKKDFDVQKFVENSEKVFDSIVLKKIEENNNQKEIIFNMRLKKSVSFNDLDVYLKSYGIKDYTYFDQDNFFQN